MQETQLYIAGRWQPAAAGGTITLLDPATEEPVGRAAQAERADAPTLLALVVNQIRRGEPSEIYRRGERLEAVVRASFSPSSFRRDTISAWLNFYVLAQTMPEARRLLSIYHRRLRSNLCHALRPLVGARAGRVADGIGALIDGVYLRQALSPAAPDRTAATALVLDHVSREIDA